MTKERMDNHVNNSIYGTPLEVPYTKEEFDQGYHYCQDWDGLFISPDGDEFKCCNCHPLKHKGEDNEFFRLV